LNQMPLAFSDCALARLFIAVGRVPHRRRGVFLRDFARYIEDGVDPRQVQKKRVENTKRQAKRRQRGGLAPEWRREKRTAHQHSTSASSGRGMNPTPAKIKMRPFLVSDEMFETILKGARRIGELQFEGLFPSGMPPQMELFREQLIETFAERYVDDLANCCGDHWDRYRQKRQPQRRAGGGDAAP